MTPLQILLAGLVGFVTFKLANYGISGTRSKHSPTDFDWKYWISDRGNWNDMILGMILFGVIARYKEMLFTAFSDNFLVAFLTPYKDEEFLFFCIGFLMTFILMLIRTLIFKIRTITKALRKS